MTRRPGTALSFFLLAGLTAGCAGARAAPPPPAISSRSVPRVTEDGLAFRDLNRNGRVDPYEDWRLSAERRAADLLSRMSLSQKAGAMMHGTAPTPGGGIGQGTAYDLPAAERLILEAHVNSLITRLAVPPDTLAEQNNRLQEIAERSPLGVPLTLSTDPRSHFQPTLGASVASAGFSQWPETLGFAAIGDPALVREFGDVVRREYRAVGLHEALSPQADLATEPRWPRISGTFGEDPERARELVQAYVEGFQNGPGGIGADSVAAVVKHWVGYGAAVDGWDGHNYYGRFARLDGALEAHIRPFEGAFAVRVAGVMPSYTILDDVTLDGRPLEKVGAGFSRPLLTDLLRGRYRFAGVILSDWAITNDCGENCRTGKTPHTRLDIATCWGVEDMGKLARFVRGVQAGLDQFGGTEESGLLVEAVRSGALTEARLDESVLRIMTQKVRLGLFENPFVDPARAAQVVGAPEFRAKAEAAQRRSLVLLENRSGTLPLRPGAKMYVYGLDPAVVRAHGFTPVERVEDGEVAVLRVGAPFEVVHPNFFFARRQHEGRLDFRDGDPDFEQIKAASRQLPTVVSITLDRPAILTNVQPLVRALLANFGAGDPALLDVLAGKARAEGRLPFELPSSMAEVEAQSPGLPHDTRHPLYPLGAGGVE